jgi:hypothetical protein
MIRLATDQDWLHKSTKEIAKFWRNKRERQIKTISDMPEKGLNATIAR